MNCSEIQQLLSQFYDGELPPDVHASVQSHIEDCPACAQELTEFRALSDLANRMPDPQPDPSAWAALKRQLNAVQPSLVTRAPRSERRWFTRSSVLAASLMIAVAISLALYLDRNEHENHMAVNFDHYLTKFVDDTDQAQQLLVAAYPNQTVDLGQAARQLRYHPVATKELPDGYALDSVQVFDMPCCKCIQCVYKKADNSTLTLFEHDSAQPIWFGKRPAVTCQCNGNSTRIVTFNGYLAASWPSGKRHLTLIGARDIEDIVAVMQHLEAHRQIVGSAAVSSGDDQLWETPPVAASSMAAKTSRNGHGLYRQYFREIPIRSIWTKTVGESAPLQTTTGRLG